MTELIVDTKPDAQAIQIDCLRKMSPSQRLKQAVDLSTMTHQLSIKAIKRREPRLDHSEALRRSVEFNYGIIIGK